MAGDVIRTFEDLQQLGEFIDAGAGGEPFDEVPFRDQAGEPLTAVQMFALAREIERDTGEKLIFKPGERRTAA